MRLPGCFPTHGLLATIDWTVDTIIGTIHYLPPDQNSHHMLYKIHSPLEVWCWPVTEDSNLYVFIFPKLIYPLNDICLCCSIYCTIAVTYER